MEIVDSKYVNLSELVGYQIGLFPHHSKFFEKRFKDLPDGDLETLNEFSIHIGKLVDGDISVYASDYDWLCAMQLDEELYFHRNGRYRLATFKEAYEQVYANRAYMTRYMNGLLMTQLWWSNHAKVMEFYRTRFLKTNPSGYSHLEIGPGHGLFLYFAASDPAAGDVCSWDISEASIALTRSALQKLNVPRMPTLELTDMFSDPSGSFDSITFSEVLEHMEQPARALEVLRSLLSPRGRLFINMPINSPAPDHLFNAESPEALGSFIESSGLRIVDRAMFPATNQSLEAARRKKLTISCAYICERA